MHFVFFSSFLVLFLSFLSLFDCLVFLLCCCSADLFACCCCCCSSSSIPTRTNPRNRTIDKQTSKTIKRNEKKNSSIIIVMVIIMVIILVIGYHLLQGLRYCFVAYCFELIVFESSSRHLHP